MADDAQAKARKAVRLAQSDFERLVDDDYLRSAMTKHRYEVNSKTDPPRLT